MILPYRETSRQRALASLLGLRLTVHARSQPVPMLKYHRWPESGGIERFVIASDGSILTGAEHLSEAERMLYREQLRESPTGGGSADR